MKIKRIIGMGLISMAFALVFAAFFSREVHSAANLNASSNLIILLKSAPRGSIGKNEESKIVDLARDHLISAAQFGRPFINRLDSRLASVLLSYSEGSDAQLIESSGANQKLREAMAVLSD